MTCDHPGCPARATWRVRSFDSAGNPVDAIRCGHHAVEELERIRAEPRRAVFSPLAREPEPIAA